MAEEGGEKSEEPTPHKLRQAREKGQVAKSREITTAVLLLLSYFLFKYMGTFMWRELTLMVRSIFLQIQSMPTDFSYAFVGYVFLLGFRGFFLAVSPIFAITFVAALITEALQTGFLFSFDPLSPRLERLNPMEGFKRIFSLKGLVETFKSILKIIIIFYIAWTAIREELPFIVVLMRASAWDIVQVGASIAYKIAIRVGFFYLLVALLDYFYRRWEYMRGLRMSRQEIKEEYKRLEGDPLIKQRMRDLQRQAAQQRMMAAVPQADVVVTNPTHIAVALKYQQAKMRAPVILAKGQRLIADEIRRLADEAGISIVENPPLAWSLFRTTKIGQEIPRELYQAVAEVLAYVYKLKKQKETRRRARLAPTPR